MKISILLLTFLEKVFLIEILTLGIIIMFLFVLLFSAASCYFPFSIKKNILIPIIQINK